MKKILAKIILLVLLLNPLIVFSSIGKATIFNPLTGDRKVINIGSKFDNDYVLEVNYRSEEKLGFSVVSDYKTTLSSPMSSTQSTVPASSVSTTDGHTLTMSDFGSKVFLTLEPGGSKQEIVMCTGISGSSWTGCTRGLAFYGSSTASVTANRKTHSAGVQVIISNVHYVYKELVDLEDEQTIGGKKNFTGNNITFTYLPTTATTAPTLDGHVANKKYVDYTINAGAPDATETVKGISELATGQEAASSTLTGGTGARLVIPTSITTSTAGIARTIPVTNAGGTIASGFYQSNNNIWSGINYGMERGLFGDGQDGDVTISATTTITRDMYYSNLTVNSGVSLNTAGFKVFVNGTTTLNGNILFNGNNGSNGSSSGNQSEGGQQAGAAGGAGATSTATSSYSMFTNIAGKDGGAGGNPGSATARVGTNATAYNGYITIGGVTGAVGGLSNGGSGSQCAQTAGTAATTTLIKYLGSPYDLLAQSPLLLSMADNAGATGGCGANHDSLTTDGTGGGGGGGGGASGGVILLFSKNIIINSGGKITANGGNGGNGGNSGNTSGAQVGSRYCSTGGGGAGGAGGNGGHVTLVYLSLTNNGSITVNGGSGGTGGTAGASTCSAVGNVNGANGNNGNSGVLGTIRYFQLR